MNKVECKKYLRRAYRSIIQFNTSLTPENIEKEIIKEMGYEKNAIIAYSKIAVYNMQNSANSEITIDDLTAQIDELIRIYPKYIAIQKAKNL